MNKNNKGSEWRKWDLHFHSPSSYDYQDKQITNQQIIEELLLKDISVVAVTDHHVIDVERIQELQTLGKEKRITVLPGIEFLSDARGDDPVHFIGIFGADSDITFIWGQIENRTDIKKIKGEGKKHNEIYCHLFDTVELIKELGGLVTIHAGKKTNGIENITHSLPHGAAQKEDIAKAIDIFEMGKETDCEGYSTHVIPHLKRTLKKHIPMIICSDNHIITNYVIKQNLWIKADQTFDGLKQILYEPEHRVKIQGEKPDFKEGKLVIDEARFLSSDGKFTGQSIHFNENLNVIIGGKSSGKSILLYNIAKTLLADKEFLRKENIEDKYKFRKDDPTFNFEIKTKGGFSQLMHRDSSENSIIPEIKYIPQNYLVKLAEPEENKKGAALNKIVRDLINEDPESQGHYDDFINRVKINDKKRESIIDNYFEIEERIITLDNQLKLKSKAEILEKNIETNTSKVEELNKRSGLDADEIVKYNQLQKQLEEVKLLRTNASNDFRKISDFNSETLDILNNIKNKRIALSNTLENPTLKGVFDQTYSQLENAFSIIDNFDSNFELIKNEEGNNVLKNTSEVSNLFLETSKSKAEIEGKLEPYLRNAELKKQIGEITKSISDDKASLQAIEHLRKDIAESKKILKDEKEKLFKIYEDSHREYINVIEELKIRTIDLEKDGLKIEGLARFNFAKFRKSLLYISDGRRASYNKFDISKDQDGSIENFELSHIISDLRKIFESIVETDEYVLVGRSDKKNAIKIFFEDYFYDYWEIDYKNDKLGKMSTGKASFVILMLIVGLSKSKAPILIDQPEDNLDNRSITTDLVEYLRNKKLERQIILVTHNPNIVVNADAENIIIANQKGQNDTETSSPYLFVS